jgi:Flp pilus assembly protein TadG
MRRRLGHLRRLTGDTRGVAALEFALVVPVVIVVYLVGFEVAEAATVYRKLSDTTVQLANVSAQYTSMNTSDTSTILAASSQIMAPYPTTKLTIILSEVTTNSSGAGSVTWSQAYQGTKLTAGTAVTMPSGFQTPSTSYVLVQTTYTYQPTIGAAFVGDIAMSDKIFMLPRSSASIPCSTC